MRFPNEHYIKQKYAPFTKVKDKWVMKRPDGILPIYCENQKPEDYVVINEGEKALLGCKSIYDGDVCTWHGGVNNLDKQDWTPLKDRKVIIFPDNDEAGKKCSEELKDKLSQIAKEVIIVKPPREFKDKDDLYDAKVNDFFSSSQQFLDYCLNNQIKKRVSFDLIKINQMLKKVEPAKWVVKDIIEEDSVVSIFGQPKSGKSFITVDMACSVALGRNWHGHETEQGSVVYLAGEGMRAISRRFLAWQQLNNTRVKDAPLLISTRGARLLDDKDHQLLKDTIDRTQDETGKVRSVREPSLLVKNVKAGGEPLMTSKAFERFMVKLAHKYKQWGIVLHNPQKGTRLIQTSDDGRPVNKVDMKMSKFNPMKVAQFYSSLKGKPFTFEGFKYADKPQNHIHGMSLQSKGEVDIFKRETTDKWMKQIMNIIEEK